MSELPPIIHDNNTDNYEYLLTSLLRITGTILIQFISCSRDLYNLMVCGLISKNEWKETFSRSTLLSIYTKQTDIIKRYDNFSVNLLGHNINIKDQFKIWTIQLSDIPNNTSDINNFQMNLLTYSKSILFILSYITLIEHYSIKYKLPLITPFIKMKRLQSTSTTFKCMFYYKHLQEFIHNIIENNASDNSTKNDNFYYNMHKRCDNGKIEKFNSKLIYYNKFDELINEIGIIFENDDLFQSLKNELFLPNLIKFKQCFSVKIGIKLFEQMYFGYYPRTLNYNAFCIKLNSKFKKDKGIYTESFLVWNGVLNDIAGSSVLNQLQYNNASFLCP
eukprot:171153_1